MSKLEELTVSEIGNRPISSGLVRHLAQFIDCTVIFAVGFFACLFYVVRFQITEISSPYFVGIFMGTFIASILFHWFNAYSEESLFSKRYIIQRLLGVWAVAFAILLSIAFALKISDYFSRVWAVTWFFGGAGTLMVARFFFWEWTERRAREGHLAERCVIFGASEFGQRFASALRNANDPFIRVLGFVDDRTTRVPQFSNGLELLGNSEILLDLIRLNMVDHVFVALPWDARDRLRVLVEQLSLMPVRVSLVSDPFDFAVGNRSVKCINNAPILQILDRPLTDWANLSKSIEDKLIAFLIMVFIFPLMVFIAIGIKIDSSGPVFFRQKRYGFNNNPIEVWKFRTMYVDDVGADEPIRQAMKDDPRVTPIGHFLRRSSLDELPQFLNVLAGDMSIVGPRPHALLHTYNGQKFEDIIERYAARHRVKPGITGWAQVNGWRGETDTIEKIQNRLKHDLYYIENWSILFDLSIIVRTIGVIFQDEKAY